jgi:hypothetical protein
VLRSVVQRRKGFTDSSWFTFPALPITCLLGGYRTFGTKTIDARLSCFRMPLGSFLATLGGSLSWSARLVCGGWIGMLHTLSLHDDDDDVDVPICMYMQVRDDRNNDNNNHGPSVRSLPACSVDSRISGSSASYYWDLYWSK